MPRVNQINAGPYAALSGSITIGAFAVQLADQAAKGRPRQHGSRLLHPADA